MKENPTHLILSTYLNRKLNFYGCHVNENGRRVREKDEKRRTRSVRNAFLINQTITRNVGVEVLWLSIAKAAP